MKMLKVDVFQQILCVFGIALKFKMLHGQDSGKTKYPILDIQLVARIHWIRASVIYGNYKLEINACNKPSPTFYKRCFNMKYHNYSNTERRLASC
jgi:hypothetical protein